jgi:hypothetical protein
MVRGWPGRVSAALLTGCLLSGLGVIHGNQLGLHFGVFSAGYLGLAIVFRIAQVLEPVEPSPARVLPEDFDENDSLSSASGSISTGEAVRPEPAH